MKIKELILKGIQNLKENQIEDSNMKARILMQHVTQKSRNQLVIDMNEEISQEKEMIYFKYLEELIKGKPLQYITHHQEFMRLDFYVDENVLIPQQDTEVLVEETMKVIETKRKMQTAEIAKNKMTKEKGEPSSVIKILDLCTGSGSIAISLAKYLQNNEIAEDVEIIGIDISRQALEIAKKNAKTNGVEVKFIISNMFKQIKDDKEMIFDIIVSNPPYIETNVINTLSKEVQNEPHLALDGGEDGLEFYKTIANEGYKFLKKDGYILVEIGYNQRENVTKLFEERKQYDTISCIKDLAENDRVIKVGGK